MCWYLEPSIGDAAHNRFACKNLGHSTWRVLAGDVTEVRLAETPYKGGMASEADNDRAIWREFQLGPMVPDQRSRIKQRARLSSSTPISKPDVVIVS
jgi:hypothetical protein